MVDKLARFVKASMKGWDWAVENPDEAAKIVLDNDETGAQTEKHQKRMMGEIAKLVGGNPKGTGWLDPAAYERTVKIAALRRVRPGHHQGAGRRLDPRDLGEGHGELSFKHSKPGERARDLPACTVLS